MSLKTDNKMIRLSGEWKFTYAEDGKLDEESVVSGKDVLEWLKCDVPGNAQLDLIKHGLIKDPFFGLNSKEIRKYEYYEWWYTRKFNVPAVMYGKKLELLFHGLDTFTKIWINGRFLGRTDNMFVPHGFDVTDYVNENENNELIIKISSPLYATRDKDLTGCQATLGAFESLWARKARHSYGWDIAPRLVTSGIWRDVELISHESFEIKDFFVRVGELKRNSAKLVFQIDMDLPRKPWENLKVKVSGKCGDSVFKAEAKVGSLRTDLTICLDEAKLWWPNGAGNPDLYDIRVILYKDEEPVHCVSDRIGIRTIEIDQGKNPAGGRNFVIKVNGRPVFVKGTNSVPMDAFHSRELTRIPQFLKMVADTNCNAVRVWGGGVYEHDLFYEMCDENGIMIFQDFMYACAIYPQSEEFLQIARNEALTVVKRLRNHPSLTIWYGDNEIDWAYYCWYEQKQSPENNKISRHVLKEVCQNCDGTRPYLPSSPFTPALSEDPNYEFEGDRHMWMHGEHFKSEKYRDDGRFYSEIGHLALPCIESIKKFIPEDKLWPLDKRDWVWDHHFGSHKVPYFHMDRMGTVYKSILKTFGAVPDNLSDLVLASQIVQAEAFKFWIERARQRKFQCGGILWWNMVDCWPQFSDAVVDYYYNKKLAYEYIKRSQNDILISLGEEEEKGNSIILVNDTLKPVEINLEIEVYERTCTRVLKYNLENCVMSENSRQTLGYIDFASASLQRGENTFVACMKVKTSKENVCSNHYMYFKPPMDFKTYNDLFDIFQNWLNK